MSLVRPDGFSFVIPVVHPDAPHCRDYRVVESLLDNTLRTLLNQTASDITLVVLCHRIPDFAADLDERVFFLDMSAGRGFTPDFHEKNDRGLKFMIGALFVERVLGSRLMMTADGDDLVHVDLAATLLARELPHDADGYLIVDGAETMVRIDDDYGVRFEFAVRVTDFDQGCGTCRIFDVRKLAARTRSTYPDLAEAVDVWLDSGRRGSGPIPAEVLDVVWTTTKDDHSDESKFVHLMGRHVRQTPPFRMVELDDFVAATKVCGHGNHSGRNGGEIHWAREVETIPLRSFGRDFGLPSASLVAAPWGPLFLSRMAHPQARRRWLRRSKPARAIASAARASGLRS